MKKKNMDNRLSMYGIYDMKDNERLVGIFRSKEAAQFLETTLGSFYSKITRGGIVHGRYRVYKL